MNYVTRKYYLNKPDAIDDNQRWAAPTPERPLHGASSASGAERVTQMAGAGAESERALFSRFTNSSTFSFARSINNLLKREDK